MVDFNNETTITVDRSKIVNILIIERRSYTINAIEKYDRLLLSGAKPPTSIVKSSILALFNEIRGTLKFSNKEKFAEIRELLGSENYSDYLVAFELIDDYLNATGLTKFVLTRSYDPRDPLAEDEAKGL